MSDPTSPQILLFARGLLALLDLWPIMTIAISEQWGGPSSGDKKIWVASTLIDIYETRATILPNTNPPQIDPNDSTDPPMDEDDMIVMVNQMMSDEFEANIEDGSVDDLAGDVVRLWRDVLVSMERGREVVEALERKAESVSKRGVVGRTRDLEEVDSGSESGSEDGDEMDVDEPPQIVATETKSDTKSKEKTEPVIDEEGFTMVQGKGRKGR